MPDVHATGLEPLEGQALTEWPLSDLTHVCDLVYHEGPLLSHFRTTSGDDYLRYWVDCDGDVNRWMYFRINEAVIIRLTNMVMTLDQVIPEKCRDPFAFVEDRDDTLGQMTACQMLPVESIPDIYRPGEGPQSTNLPNPIRPLKL